MFFPELWQKTAYLARFGIAPHVEKKSLCHGLTRETFIVFDESMNRATKRTCMSDTGQQTRLALITFNPVILGPFTGHSYSRGFVGTF